MRSIVVLVLSLPLCFIPLYAGEQGQQHEQPKLEEEKPASDSRSYMELFTKLEHEWIQAVQKKDKTTLDAILAPEFTLRTSENPENSQSRADWVQNALTSYDIHSFSQRAMAIRAFLGVAVVSFVQSEQITANGKDSSHEYFVVDLWKANHNKWQVCARYISPTGSSFVEDTKTNARR